MKSKLGSFLVTALGLLLLIYSGLRSVDFISLTLPPDKAILAYFGLAALDGGLVFWLLSFMYGSHGWQRVISLIMIIIDFMGAVAMFTMDTLYNTGQAGMTSALSPQAIQTAVLVLSGIIAANVGATVMHHIMAPENLRQMAEEEALDKIESLAIKEIGKNASILAAELVPQMGKSWMEQARSNYLTVIKGRKKVLPELPAQIMDQAQPAMAILASELKQTLPLPENEEVLPETTNPTKPARRRSQKVS